MRSSRSHLPAVLALLGLFVVCGWVSLSGDSATSDETAHLPAGYTYLDRGDFRLNPEHPPLAKAWAALPSWLAGTGRPGYAGEPWKTADQWRFGFDFLQGEPDPLLHPARAMILVLGVLLCLAVYGWSRALWGREGALLALGLCALSPPVLAHARLVTTDLPAALGFTTSLWAFARWLRVPSWGRASLAGLALGAALLVKFTTLLLLPMLGLAAAGWAWRQRRARPLLGVGAIGLIAWAVLWAGYGFRFSPGEAYSLPWEAMARAEGPHPGPMRLARDLRLAPEAYLYGLTSALHDETRLAYLRGAESVVGWRSYFPIAFALKTPPAFLLLSAWALAAAPWRGRRREVALLLLAPIALYALVSIRSRLNIGHRHLLPIYPLLCVMAGSIAVRARERRAAAWALGLCLAGTVVSFAVATPGYLSYFNLFGGGARGGWRYLLDSNLDWGQDLKRLAGWQREHGNEPVHLAYFGTADPRAYGLHYRKVVWVHDFRPEEPAGMPRSGELLAVSLNLREGLYLERDRELARAVHGRGWMEMAAIRRYTAMRLDRIERAVPYPTFAEWALAERLLTPQQITEASEDLLATFFARLRDTQEPVGRAGDSIVVYRVP